MTRKKIIIIVCVAMACAAVAGALRCLLPYRWLERPAEQYVSVDMSDLPGNTATLTDPAIVAELAAHIKKLPLWQMQHPGTPDYDRDTSDAGVTLVFTREDGQAETLDFWGTTPRVEKRFGPEKWAVSAKDEWVYNVIHEQLYSSSF